MTGQIGPNGKPTKKPTGMTSNDEALHRPLRKFKCDENHEHKHCTGSNLRALHLWTWALAVATADYVCTVVRRTRHRASLGHTCERRSSAYLTIGTDAQAPEAAPSSTDPYNCPGWRRHQSRHDASHTRVPGECHFLLDETITYDCPGCAQGKPAAHSNHTYETGHCKWGSVEDPSTRRLHGRVSLTTDVPGLE